MNQNIQISFNIILHAGNAKSLCMKANIESRNYNFEQAKKYMEEAMNELTIAMLAKENSLEFMELYKKIQILERGNMI